jgi:hypothetical protein
VKFDFSDLIAKAQKIDQRIAQTVLDVTQKVTLDVHANVVRGSPVDTGEFRGAWTVETPTAPYENSRVENTTVYGPQLMRGSSTQAPNGWVDDAVQAATKLGGS